MEEGLLHESQKELLEQLFYPFAALSASRFGQRLLHLRSDGSLYVEFSSSA